MEKKSFFSKTLPTKKFILRVHTEGAVRKSFRHSVFFLRWCHGGSDTWVGGVSLRNDHNLGFQPTPRGNECTNRLRITKSNSNNVAEAFMIAHIPFRQNSDRIQKSLNNLVVIITRN